jgi:hypothetical protein
MSTFEKITKLEPVEYFIINGHEINAQELYSVLMMLDSSDGFMPTVVIDDWTIETALLSIGAVKKTLRGSCYRGPAFEEFCAKVGYLIDEF